MSRIPLADHYLSEMEKFDEEAGNAVHVAMLEWVQNKAQEAGVPKQLVIAAAGKALIIEGYIMLGAAAGLTAEQGQLLCKDSLRLLNEVSRKNRKAAGQ
jgi:hypothetical protein